MKDPDWSVSTPENSRKGVQSTPAQEFRQRLEQLGWGQKRAATMLGVERNTVRSWQRWPSARPPSTGMVLALQLLRAHLALQACCAWYSPYDVRDRIGLENLRGSVAEPARRRVELGWARDGADL